MSKSLVSHRDYETAVRLAQDGDTGSFGELITQFQDLAVVTAYGWLGDAEAARDVAQDAFLDAHRHLGALREPRAFPGWLRRIVIKHCDRMTRRKRIDLLAVAPVSDAERGPEMIHTAAEEAQLLRFAVDALPPAERIVISLQYFAEASGAEVSAFLELPVSTIKQRLRRARQRLREKGESLMATTLDNMRPSQTGQFAREIEFFIAIRAGDRAVVSRLLQEDPGLLEALQDWDPGLVRSGVLPFANKATPLITAIERGDLAMQTLLLEAGADVNGVCGCATGEPPIWAAAVMDRVEHARQLLQQGADPNLFSSCGNSALHVAAMRGRRDMVALLLGAGADPGAPDCGVDARAQWVPLNQISGSVRTPLQWAHANGHLEVAAMLTDAAKGTTTALAAAAQTPAAAIPRPQIVHTGIKALDLFAPLVRGGVVRFPFAAGVGMVVLLSELCSRFLAKGSRALWTGFTQPPFDHGDWSGEMAETGLAGRIDSSLAGFNEDPAVRRAAFHAGLDRALSLCDEGNDVLVIILSTLGFENEIESSLMQLRNASEAGSVTSIIVTPFPEQRDAWHAVEAPYTGQIALDRSRARQHLFPAIDPRRSLTRGLDEDLVGGEHLQLAARARELLEAYKQQDPEFLQVHSNQAGTAGKGQALARYLCQPFTVTEPFTGIPGEHVSHAEMLREVAQILQST